MASSTMLYDRDAASELDRPHQIAELLQREAGYAAEPGAVRQIETHISWVFLTDRFAYKLKKPVRFDFLDFSTAELRRQACENEVRLNRRLAPRVYLGVVPVVLTAAGHLALDGSGVPVDWVVKMRRLPAENSLDVLIRDGRVSPIAIEQLATTLTTFYEKAPPVTMTIDNYRRNIERHAMANRDELAAEMHCLDQRQIRRTHSALLRVLKLAPDLLDERVRNGRIVEGHGDLRPEHIYFNPSPVVIDCIEFNQEFRTLDVIDELAFLAMECDLLADEQIAKSIFERYFERSEDAPPRELIDFYRLYRACVRAKVSVLRAEQLASEPRMRQLAVARKYLDLADRYSQSLGPPLLIVVRGLPGTGKSTIAEAISEQLGFELLQTDVIRRAAFGPRDDHFGYNEGRYREENRASVYNTMHVQAEQLLSRGMSVVLDGTYSSASLRNEAARLAKQQQAEYISIQCRCPDEVSLRRINTRRQAGQTLSDARPEFFERQRLAEELDPPDQRSLDLDTADDAVEPLQIVFEALRKRCFKDATIERYSGSLFHEGHSAEPHRIA